MSQATALSLRFRIFLKPAGRMFRTNPENPPTIVNELLSGHAGIGSFPELFSQHITVRTCGEAYDDD
jgi:hypothetical protein